MHPLFRKGFVNSAGSAGAVFYYETIIVLLGSVKRLLRQPFLRKQVGDRTIDNHAVLRDFNVPKTKFSETFTLC